RAANDWIAELFIAWPSFFSMRSFRRNHLAHHQYTNEPRDPDWARKQVDPDYWRFPRSRAAIAWLFLKDVLGLHVHKTI
ncbi:fatty acid desaturase, partial [Acinetobacter baumannii]